MKNEHIDRRVFLERVSALSALAVVAGCTGATLPLNPVSSRRVRSQAYTYNGWTFWGAGTATALTFYAQSPTGITTVVARLVKNSTNKTVTASAHGYPTAKVLTPTTYTGYPFSIVGHSVTPTSTTPSYATVSGPRLNGYTNFSRNLSTETYTVGQKQYASLYEQNFQDPAYGGGGGGTCKLNCRYNSPSTTPPYRWAFWIIETAGLIALTFGLAALLPEAAAATLIFYGVILIGGWIQWGFDSVEDFWGTSFQL